jgi:hypothetical protein
MAEISENVSITKLNNSNYQLWKLKMQVMLRRDGVWDNVNLLQPSADTLLTDCDQWESKPWQKLALQRQPMYTFLC